MSAVIPAIIIGTLVLFFVFIGLVVFLKKRLPRILEENQRKRAKTIVDLEMQKTKIENEREAARIKVCKYCGTQNTGNVTNCGNCGAGL